mmetsp:Transcript_59868/g.129774  ORF Transcript_59868/g.129774 Transcript_59868/m.129774 type:complete len:759 (-) Transcript_59868:8-2284(-)
MASQRSRVRNDNFFRKEEGAQSVQAKVSRAFQLCAECGTLNLSSNGLAGDLPASVCGFQEASWSQNWWEQCSVLKIDISHNSLERIPPEIGNLSDCAAFVAVSNRLTSLPGELFENLPLKQLNLRQNMLEALPGPQLARATSLVELVVSENCLAALPAGLFNLGCLEVLDVSGNQLLSLSDSWACSKLKRLDISRNRLTKLPGGLQKCSSLRELSAVGNALRDLENLFDVELAHGWCTSLVSLDLSRNELGPTFRLSHLEALDSLNVASNKIELLNLLGSFPRLSAVLADGNRIRDFPQALLPAGAPSLGTLSLANNDLRSIPPELGLSKNLKRISLEGNPLRSIRPELLRSGAEKLKSYLRGRLEGPAGDEAVQAGADGELQSELFLHLRTAAATHQLKLENLGLKEMPTLPPGLRLLKLLGSSLTADALIAGLGLASKAPNEGLSQDLSQLDLGRNSLGEGHSASGLVGTLLRGLPSLTDLDLSFNGLASIDLHGQGQTWSGPGKLALKRADFSGNAVVALPGALLAACPALRELRLRRNRIASLAEAELAVGSALNTLDLEENQVSSLPPWLPGRLPQLHTLLLANNEIASLPAEWGGWTSLQAVSLTGNPLRNIRQALVAKGWPAIAAHLRDRLPEGQSDLPASMPHAARPLGRESAAARRGDESTSSPTGLPLDSAVVRAALGGPASQDPGSAGPLDARISRLSSNVAALEDELHAPGMTRARQSAVTHSLRMKRAELLKAEQELRRRSQTNS